MIEVIELKTKTFSTSVISDWGANCAIWGKHGDPAAGSLILVSDTMEIEESTILEQSSSVIKKKHSFMWIDQSLLPMLLEWALNGSKDQFANGFALREHRWPSGLPKEESFAFELLNTFDCPKTFSGKTYQFDKEIVCMDLHCPVAASHCHWAQINAALPSLVCPNTRHY